VEESKVEDEELSGNSVWNSSPGNSDIQPEDLIGSGDRKDAN